MEKIKGNHQSQRSLKHPLLHSLQANKRFVGVGISLVIRIQRLECISSLTGNSVFSFAAITLERFN